MSARVLIAARQLQLDLDRFRDRFEEAGIEVETPEIVQGLSEEQLLPIIQDFDGMIAGDDEVTAAVLEAGQRLKVVAKWGVGVDAIDREAARRLGIEVSNTPDVFADEVADVTVCYLILLARRLHEIDRRVRQGEWPKVQGDSLRGKTLGIIGVGSIGGAVADRAAVMGLSLLGTDVREPDAALVERTRLRMVPLETLLTEADIVSLSAPLTPATRHVIDEDALARMKPGAWLINTARGPLVDESALVAALEAGHIGGAALDVFEQEPLPAASPLRGLPGVILGAHNASFTYQAVQRVNELVVDNLLAGLDRAAR